MPVVADKIQNLQTAYKMIGDAVQRYQPHLVVLPENFNTLYGKQYYEQNAEIIPTGETYTFLAKIAKEFKIYLVAGSIPERDIKFPNFFYNTTMVFDFTGALIAQYRKIHLFEIEFSKDFTYHELEYVKPGNQLAYFEIENIKIGLGIGYDLQFAELAQLYREKGVHMIVYAASFPAFFEFAQWEQLVRSRAIDNQVFVVGASTVRDDKYAKSFVSYGHSMLVDYRGHVLNRAYDFEDILFAEFDFYFLETFRKQLPIWKQKRDQVYSFKQLL